MKAAVWMGKKKMEVQEVADPRILNPRDCIVKVTATAICGSDVHLYNGVVPTLEKGDILGHEFMGEVVEVGPAVKKIRVGDRVVVPFTIACGACSHCVRTEWSCCDNTNPNAHIAEALNGYSPAGLFGFSHMTGGYAGGQAEYVRVPFADVGPIKIESDIPDEKVLFLSDIFPTGYMAAENCNIVPGRSVVAVWGCGPVGQFAIRSAFLLGAARVIAIDSIPERLALAEKAGATAIPSGDDVMETLKAMTGGRGPDAAIDAVGMEAHGSTYDDVKQTLKMETDRPFALRQAMRCVRKAGTLSVPGVYAGFLDKIPFGAVMNKGVTIKTGQTHMQRYLRPLLELVEEGKIDPSCIITHRVPLSQAPEAYAMFADRTDGCIKVVLDPSATSPRPSSASSRYATAPVVRSGSIEPSIHPTMKKISSPRDLLVEELKDLHSAETQLLKALPKMAGAASSEELREAFETHCEQTHVHVERLEKIGEQLGEPMTGKTCKAMAGLIAEGEDVIDEDAEPTMRDLALIGAAQKAEHYEIAGYGTTRTLAELAGEEGIAGILQETLDEEGETDEQLTQIAADMDLGVHAIEADEDKT